MHQISHLNLRRKIGFKQMVTRVERATLIAKLNSKIHCESQVAACLIADARPFQTGHKQI